MLHEYELLDSGNFKKLERFGKWVIQRPALSASWEPMLAPSKWKALCHASFTRLPQMRWQRTRFFPDSWVCHLWGIAFRLKTTDFGHLGVFPEQGSTWQWLKELASSLPPGARVLNLFAYSGGSSLALAKEGVQVTHVDASKGMVQWAKENALLNHLPQDRLRWIVDDVFKFVKRELKRSQHYEGILLDPPSYGKGKKGEVFKIEEDLLPLLKLLKPLLSPKARFLFLSCHTPAYTPLALTHLIKQSLGQGSLFSGELTLPSSSFPLPAGSFAKWEQS